MKRIKIHCSYCGALAIKRPASYVYGKSAEKGLQLYVCSSYPMCDSYVAAHKKSGLPMGTLANKSLRRKRIAAHKSLDNIWKHGYMTREQVYKWLQIKLNLTEPEMHIGNFNESYCNLLIFECERAYRNFKFSLKEAVKL